MSERLTDATKQCPFCAETIKAAAVVCRFCGRELTSQAAPMASGSSDRQLLDQEIADYTHAGWRITSQSPTAFQAMRPRKWPPFGLALALVLLLFSWLWYPLVGLALLVLLITCIVYLGQKEEQR